MQWIRHICHCPYRFHPTARLFFRLSCTLAASLVLFALVAESRAAAFLDPLTVYRYVRAAWDAAPTTVAVGVMGGVWLDLAKRQFSSR